MGTEKDIFSPHPNFPYIYVRVRKGGSTLRIRYVKRLYDSENSIFYVYDIK